jgi:hypothetical protein
MTHKGPDDRAPRDWLLILAAVTLSLVLAAVLIALVLLN